MFSVQKVMDLLVKGSFAQTHLASQKLGLVFQVLKTTYYVNQDETVQAYIRIKLLIKP